jgi:DNA ligase-1
MRSNDIREWTAEASGLPIWLFEETYHIVGDLAETVAKVLPDPENIGPDRSLKYWMEYIMALPAMELLERKSKILAAWRALDAWQRFVFNKMMMAFSV